MLAVIRVIGAVVGAVVPFVVDTLVAVATLATALV